MSTLHKDAPAQARAEGEAQDQGGIERRRSTREPVFTHGLLRSLERDAGGNSPEQVMVTDVSLHGVGFRSPRKLPLGMTFEIEIGVGPLHLASKLCVVRARPRADGTWDIGAEFC